MSGLILPAGAAQSIPVELPNAGEAASASKLHTRLGDRVSSWVFNALAKAMCGEKIAWELAFQLLPTPQGPQPVYALLLQAAAPVMGQNLNHLVLLGIDGLSAQVVEQQVREAVEVVRTRRSDMLAAGQPGGAP